jgi:hypothetical protein
VGIEVTHNSAAKAVETIDATQSEAIEAMHSAAIKTTDNEAIEAMHSAVIKATDNAIKASATHNVVTKATIKVLSEPLKPYAR